MKRETRSFDILFILSIFCLFAASVLFALMLGTKIYSSMQSSSQDTYYRRTALAYVTEKIRHGDSLDAVSVGEIGGTQALILSESMEGVEYQTSIYLFDGWICELFCEKGLGLPPEAGNHVVEAENLAFEEITQGAYKISYLDPSGNPAQTIVWLRSAEGNDE